MAGERGRLRVDYIRERGGFWFVQGASDAKVSIVINAPNSKAMRQKVDAVIEALNACYDAANE